MITRALLLLAVVLPLSGCLVPGYCSGRVFSVTNEAWKAAKATVPKADCRHRPATKGNGTRLVSAKQTDGGHLRVRVLTTDGTLHTLDCDPREVGCSDGKHVLVHSEHHPSHAKPSPEPVLLTGKASRLPGVWAAGTARSDAHRLEVKGHTLAFVDGDRLATFSRVCKQLVNTRHRCPPPPKWTAAHVLAFLGLPVTLSLDAALFSTQVALTLPLFWLLGAFVS
jgi:hypothetical protein